MKSDLAADMELSLVVHYPSQFFLLKILEQRSVFLEQVAITNLFIEKLEIIKQRNSRNRKCSNDVDNYDKTIVVDVIHKTGCRPPYIKLPQSFPKCKTQKEIAVGKIDMLTRTRVRIPDACHRITEVRQNFENIDDNSSSWLLIIANPDFVKLITQSKDVDVHALIGNIGGYLGLFLGEVTILIL